MHCTLQQARTLSVWSLDSRVAACSTLRAVLMLMRCISLR